MNLLGADCLLSALSAFDAGRTPEVACDLYLMPTPTTEAKIGAEGHHSICKSSRISQVDYPDFVRGRTVVPV